MRYRTTTTPSNIRQNRSSTAIKARRLGLGLLAVLATALTVAPAANAADAPGSQDHPMLSRIDNSTIKKYSNKAFDQLIFPTGAATDNKTWESKKSVEGKVTRIDYQGDDQTSSFQAFRSYQQALSKAGFETVYACQREAECGNWFAPNWNKLPGQKFQNIQEDQQFYLAAKLERKEGDVWVVLYTHGDAKPKIELRVAEVEPLENQISVDADSLASSLQQTGRVVVDGIYFETDRAELQPSSNLALETIAQLMKQNKSLEVFIVGHTDNTGAYNHNVELSQNRAHSVVSALSQKHGIEKARLEAIGVGPVAPKASNDQESGRSLNRRVELVAR